MSRDYAGLVQTRVPREPSMLDVARRAGVSHQTVSRVLNEHPHVRESTRARVREAIEQLGYRPNSAARALARGRYQTIGVVAPRSTLFGPVSLLAAFEEQAAGSGFSVTVSWVRRLDEESIGDAVERHLDQGVAGIVVIAPVESALPALAQLPATLPAISIDGVPTGSVTSVSIDQAEGARIATRHLLAAGHPTVWHVTGPADWFDAAGRVRGWCEALREAGASVPPTVPGDWSAASGYRAGQLLGRMPEVTAVFTANDAQAVGLLRALHELGRVVPRDVSVVGFDDVPDAAYLIPPLTTVRQDFDAVARRALEVLLNGATDAGDSSSGAAVAVRPVLVSRSSVAAPPR
jgi:DNA-binding LacI/PurR family transcriptional regulator